MEVYLCGVSWSLDTLHYNGYGYMYIYENEKIWGNCQTPLEPKKRTDAFTNMILILGLIFMNIQGKMFTHRYDLNCYCKKLRNSINCEGMDQLHSSILHTYLYKILSIYIWQ